MSLMLSLEQASLAAEEGMLTETAPPDTAEASISEVGVASA